MFSGRRSFFKMRTEFCTNCFHHCSLPWTLWWDCSETHHSPCSAIRMSTDTRNSFSTNWASADSVVLELMLIELVCGLFCTFLIPIAFILDNYYVIGCTPFWLPIEPLPYSFPYIMNKYHIFQWHIVFHYNLKHLWNCWYSYQWNLFCATSVLVPRFFKNVYVQQWMVKRVTNVGTYFWQLG